MEPGGLGGDDAAKLLGVLTRIEHSAVAANTKLARRVEQSSAWHRAPCVEAQAKLTLLPPDGIQTY